MCKDTFAFEGLAMSLTPSTKLGSYEILAAIGAGGMGEGHYSWTDEANPFLHVASSIDLPFSPLGRRMG